MIKLSKPLIPESEIQRVVDILLSGNLVQGVTVESFEKSLAEYLGTKFAIAVSSGTAALHLALLASGIKPGDEVIVPAFTFPATANVVEMAGARTVLVDITCDDYCIDTRKIEAAITPKTRAIIPVHEFGQAANISPILDLAQKHDLWIIEDAACALGTMFKGKKAGTFGDIGCFSFHPRKAITTGEGGLVTTDSEELAVSIRELRNHGIERKAGNVDFVRAGLNYRLTEFQAMLGLIQMPGLEEAFQTRTAVAQAYSSILEGEPYLQLPKTFPERRHVFQTYHLLLESRIDRNRVIARLREKGIEANYGANALHLVHHYKTTYGYREDAFPEAAKAYHHGLALPMGSHLSADDINFIAQTLIEVCLE